MSFDLVLRNINKNNYAFISIKKYIFNNKNVKNKTDREKVFRHYVKKI